MNNQNDLIDIFVKQSLAGGQSITFKVMLNESIQNLKKKVQESFGFAEEIRLVFGGKELQNGETILKYGITKFSTLYVVRRLKGGVKNKK